MKVWGIVCTAVMACSLGCSSNGHQDAEKAGSLAVALTANDSHGELYRLRSANFNIQGYPDYYYAGTGGSAGSSGYYYDTWSSEENLDSPTITHKVVPGYYYVSFDTGSGWYLEHLTSGGAERVDQAVLLSSPSQSTYVYDQGDSTVSYTFGVDGQLIDFRNGNLNIGIQIEHPGEDHGAGGFGTGGAFMGLGGAVTAGGPSAGGSTGM